MKTLTPALYAEKYHDTVKDLHADLRLQEAEAGDYILPRRRPVSHKYSYGRALVIAGARGYSGAPVLAANACERSGAGLTHLMTPESIYAIAAARCDGAVVTPLPANGRGSISAEALPQILEQLQKANACVVGPGLGTGPDSQALVKGILRGAACPLVLDADALTALSGETTLLDSCAAPLILTPHEGEFKRLGGELSGGRLHGALAFTKEHPHLILILKGYGTLVCRGGEAAVNPTGGPAMAKGGAGDVLCGVLCALLAQGFDPWFAARCAVWLHGAAGDLAAAETGEYSLAPSDLIRHLPAVFRKLIR